MSFDKWKFAYTPPPTVEAPYTPGSATASVLETPAGTVPDSAAATLQARVQVLQDANQYLQSVILATSAGVGVELDPAVDPETATALASLYPGQDIPKVVTVPMYNRLLDLVAAGDQINTALGTNQPYEVNPFKLAAGQQVLKMTESNLVQSGQFVSQFPLLLRSLKGDVPIFNALHSALGEYPVAAGKAVSVTSNTSHLITASTVDVSPSLSGMLNSALDSFGQSYAGIYKLASQVSAVDQDVNTVLNKYFYQPVADLVRIIAVLTHLNLSVHVPNLRTLVNGLTNAGFSMLAAEILPLRCYADRFLQMATAPLQSMTSDIGQMVSQIQKISTVAQTSSQSVKNSFATTKGPLAGMSGVYNSGLPGAGTALPQLDSSLFVVPGVGNLEGGLASLSAHIAWGIQKADSKVASLEESVQKLLYRRTQDMNDQLDIMSSVQSLNSLISLAQSVLSFNGNQAASGASSTVSQVQAVGQILSSLQSGNGVTYALAQGTLQAVPRSLPIPASNVQSLFQNAGLSMIVASKQGVSSGVSA